MQKDPLKTLEVKENGQGDYTVIYECLSLRGVVTLFHTIVIDAPSAQEVRRLSEEILNGPQSTIFEIRPRKDGDCGSKVRYPSLIPKKARA